MEFFKTKTGKAVEKGLWEMAVIFLGIGVVASQDANMTWLIPFVPVMLFATKFINTNYLKD